MADRWTPFRTRLLSRYPAVLGDECMPYGGRLTAAGYGRIRIDGRNVLAHRAMYALFVGSIPEGLEPDHLCHTRDLSCPGGPTCPHRACGRPDHLEVVTRRENCLRGRSFSASNAAKTHCAAGHPFADNNLIIRSSGNRDCRTCTRERKQSCRPPQSSLYCKRGHELYGANLRLTSGRRTCRACAAIRDRDYAAARLISGAAVGASA